MSTKNFNAQEIADCAPASKNEKMSEIDWQELYMIWEELDRNWQELIKKGFTLPDEYE